MNKTNQQSKNKSYWLNSIKIFANASLCRISHSIIQCRHPKIIKQKLNVDFDNLIVHPQPVIKHLFSRNYCYKQACQKSLCICFDIYLISRIAFFEHQNLKCVNFSSKRIFYNQRTSQWTVYQLSDYSFATSKLVHILVT